MAGVVGAVGELRRVRKRPRMARELVRESIILGSDDSEWLKENELGAAKVQLMGCWCCFGDCGEKKMGWFAAWSFGAPPRRRQAFRFIACLSWPPETVSIQLGLQGLVR